MSDAPRQPLHPRIRTVWQIGAFAAALAVSVVAFVAAALLDIHPAAPAVVAFASIAAAVTLPGLAYRRWRYEIRENDVFISKGFMFHTLALMPFDRIQFVETQQGPLDRSFGLTQLIIKTAGGSVSIPGLTEQEATRLRERLSEVVGTLSV